MANYPQLDDCSGVWTLKEVNDAIMGGYWRNAGSRGISQGGGSPSNVTALDEITIASAGDAVDFGDCIVNTSGRNGYSSFIRGMFAGGKTPLNDAVDYITIATRGNAADFGDLTGVRNEGAGMSDSHGGLQH